MNLDLPPKADSPDNKPMFNLSEYILDRVEENKKRVKNQAFADGQSKANGDQTPPLFMSHLVAGYPTIDKNITLAVNLAEAGVSLLEVQLPFSDPMADGPVIMRANQTSLDRGTNLSLVFELFQQLRSRLSIPILAMTYYNIPFSMGLEKFFTKLVECRVQAVIVPDIPFDEHREKFYEIAKAFSIDPIIVLSPTISQQRLETALSVASGMIYVTLRVGITGGKTVIEERGINFLKKLRSLTSLPLAAGFGISSPAQVQDIGQYADIAVVGSHMIELVDNFGIESAKTFVRKSLMF